MNLLEEEEEEEDDEGEYRLTIFVQVHCFDAVGHLCKLALSSSTSIPAGSPLDALLSLAQTLSLLSLQRPQEKDLCQGRCHYH